MPKNDALKCRVCGWTHASPPWGENGSSPTFEICSCCGTEFGYEDANADAIKSARQRWIDSGGKWFSPAMRPSGWSLEEQLESIPAVYK